MRRSGHKFPRLRNRATRRRHHTPSGRGGSPRKRRRCSDNSGRRSMRLSVRYGPNPNRRRRLSLSVSNVWRRRADDTVAKLRITHRKPHGRCPRYHRRSAQHGRRDAERHVGCRVPDEQRRRDHRSGRGRVQQGGTKGSPGSFSRSPVLSNSLADASSSVSASSTMLQGVVADYATTRETLAGDVGGPAQYGRRTPSVKPISPPISLPGSNPPRRSSARPKRTQRIIWPGSAMSWQARTPNSRPG